jgi:cytochrome subunit of sulfide dehydrogenase
MMASQSVVFAIAIGLLVLSADSGTAADNEGGTQLAAMCASCHRLDGRDEAIPTIVGMGKEEFTKMMTAFKSGARSSSIMRAVALQLSDAEIAMLAEYLAARAKESKQR